MTDSAVIDRAKATRIEIEIERRGIKLSGTTEREGPCPKCGGRDRFSINTEKQVWNCRGCDKGGDVIGLVQHLDGCSFAEAVEKLAGKKPGPWKLIREHIYKTADGAPLMRKQKYLKPDGGREFPQYHWDGKQWIKGAPKEKLLYRLPELLAAPITSPVYITEGEGDSDKLAAINFVVTTAGGVSETKQWARPEFVEPLKGRRVVIVVDSDTPGRKYGQKVARALDKVADSLKVVDLYPEDMAEKDGRDVSDFITTDGVGVKFIQRVKDAPEWEPSAEPESEPPDDDELIAELARLSALEYERRREKEAERLGVRVSILDRLVAAARGKSDDDDGKHGRAIVFTEIAPWPQPVEGAPLLDDLAAAIRNHVVMSEHAAAVAALWCVHAYLLDQFFITPRLAIISPTKGCGKTTLLDVVSCLALRPLSTANISAAALYRTIEAYRPTLSIDEGDTFLSEREELRGILNSGHRRGGYVLRTVGDDFEPRAFATYAAVAIALIGKLPDTLADRSVTITLKRRMPGEKISALRLDRVGHLRELARKIARWAADHAQEIGAADPEMPDGIYNRAADNWRPLMSIADVVGGEWPERARKAALADCEAADSKSKVEQLVSDLEKVWGEQSADRLSSAALIGGLVGLPDSQWGEYGKSRKPISQVQLARLLKPLGIMPQLIRSGDDVSRGYLRSQFEEAFQRYGSYASSPEQGAPRRYSVTNPDEMGTSDIFQGVTGEPDVTGRKCEKSNNDGLCNGVADQKGGDGKTKHIGPQSGADGEAELPPGVEYLGRAQAGVKCDLCGKSSGVLRVRQTVPGAGVLELHAECVPKVIRPRGKPTSP